MATRLSVSALLRLDAGTVRAVLDFLAERAHLSSVQRARVVAQRPDLLRAVAPLATAHAALAAAGLRPPDFRRVVFRWPGLLLLDPARIARAAAFLRAPSVGLAPPHLRALLRRAPWVLVYDVDADMAPAVAFLRRTLDIPDDAPLHGVVLASPLLLGTSPACMRDVVDFLRDAVSLDQQMMAATLRSFPPLLTCSVEQSLRPAVEFLKTELGLQVALSKVVRAFPTVLTLDVEANMRVVVDYFRGRGVVNVGRIVTLLPPILGYDLETNIIPKMEYVEKELGLSSYDILGFPGYFSYSLEKCIEPRTKFLQARRQSVTESGLNLALSLTDEDFCKRIAGVPVSHYYSFRKAYRQRKAEGDVHEGQGGADPEYGETFAENTGTVRRTSRDSSWENPEQDNKRRKRRFRATLSRMPWNELK